MGRRSNFTRNKRDYYRTFDPIAGEVLSEWIKFGNIRYVEPFAGNGDLVNQIDKYATCVYACDIEPQNENIHKKDAFDITEEDLKKLKADCIITNTPWNREIFHKAIEHFTPKVRCCWFLIDAPWIFTKQAAPYIERYVTDIVTIGRMKWIPNTNMSSKDDSVWIKTCDIKNIVCPNFWTRIIKI